MPMNAYLPPSRLVNHLPLFGALFGTPQRLVWGLSPKANPGLKDRGPRLPPRGLRSGGWIAAHISGEKAEHFVVELPLTESRAKPSMPTKKPPKRPTSSSCRLGRLGHSWPSTSTTKALAGPL